MEPPLKRCKQDTDTPTITGEAFDSKETVENEDPFSLKLDQSEKSKPGSPLVLYQESVMVTRPEQEQSPKNINIPHHNPWDSARSKLLQIDDTVGALETIKLLSEQIHSVPLGDYHYPILLATIVPILPLVLKSVACALPQRHVQQHHSSNTCPDDPWYLPDPEDSFLFCNPPDPLEFQLRHEILILCTKFHHTEALRPYASLLLQMSLDVLLKDCEDNAMLALKLVFDLHRNYRNILAEHVPPFLEFCTQVYKNFRRGEDEEAWMQVWHPWVRKPCSSETETQVDTQQTVEEGHVPIPSISSAVSSHPPTQGQTQGQTQGLDKMISSPTINPLSITTITTMETDLVPSAVEPLEGGDRSSISSSPGRFLPTTPIRNTHDNSGSNLIETPDPMAPADKTPVVDTGVSPRAPADIAAKDEPMELVHVDDSIVYYVPPKAVRSYRVLMECPLTIMLLFQLYPKCIKTYLPQLLPLMMDALLQRPPSIPVTPKINITSVSTVVNPLNATAQDGKNPLDQYLTQKLFQIRSKELLSIQVKTLNFITYLLKGFIDKLKPYEDRLAASVMNILSTIPRDALSIRREALISLGHIFTTDFRKGFLRHVDYLLDERILLGSGRQQQGELSYIDLRPIAYRALADFLHHGRSKLTMAQVSKVVQMYSKILHDTMMNMSLSMKALAIRMLLNMVDHVFHNKEAKASLGRDIMFRILEASVNMLGTIVIHGIEKFIMMHQQLDESSFNPSYLDDLKVEQVREILRPILMGSRNLFHCINNYGVQREKSRKDIIANISVTSGLSDEAENKARSGYDDLSLQKFTLSELGLIGKYFEWGLQALSLFKHATEESTSQTGGGPQSKRVSVSDFEYFTASLSVLDGHSFNKVVGSRIQLLVKMLGEDDAFMTIPKYLLSKNSGTSRDFAVCIIPLLLHRSPYLATEFEEIKHMKESCGEARSSDIMYQLYDTLFSSLSLFPKNESVLRPYIQIIVSECLRGATASYPVFSGRSMKHFSIMRSMFRAISAGKFEESYKEILPILPTLLNGLYRTYVLSRNFHFRVMVLELLLTVPARLSSLLPHLPLMLRIIVPAINTGVTEITNIALRTLEFWIDNLNIDFLFPILAQDTSILAELMTSLSAHLQPAPYQFGLLTLRILGKLGGKNRSFLPEPMELRNNALPDTSFDRGTDEILYYQFGSFRFPLPLQLSVAFLKSIPENQRTSRELSSPQANINDRGSVEKFLENIDVDNFDIDSYNSDIVHSTMRSIALSAFDVLIYGLTSLVNLSEGELENMASLATPVTVHEICSHGDAEKKNINEMLLLVLDGMMYATLFDYLKPKAKAILDGLSAYLIFLCVNHQREIFCTDEQINIQETPENIFANVAEFRPFGCAYSLSPPHVQCFDVLIMNELFARVLSQGNGDLCHLALHMIQEIQSFYRNLSCRSHSAMDNCDTEQHGSIVTSNERILYVHLLYQLCLACLSASSIERFWLMEGIFKLMVLMGKEWSLQFEVLIIHAALHSISHSISEIPRSRSDSMMFFVRICWFLHGAPSHWLDEPGKIIRDDFSLPQDLMAFPSYWSNGSNDVAFTPVEQEAPVTPELLQRSISILIQQISSINGTTRFACRYGLRQLCGDSRVRIADVLERNTSALRKTLFSRSLRNLSLSEQIASIETLFFVVMKAPHIFPLTDNLLLAYLLDLLKMLGVADKEMMSESVSPVQISDKDGYCPTNERNDNMINWHAYLMNSSQIFLNDDILLQDTGFHFRVLLPRQLPHGIQLRLSSLGLFHSLIKHHSEDFFSAPSTSALANIRPHVISLLFRSLTSRPVPCAVAAHAALRDILILSSKTVEVTDDPQGNSSNRLSKDLLQTCIRPILVNIRDCTKLSIPLLRGISRLLSLLSSWFSKTLGEKLLDHLQHWSDSEKIVKLNLCREGDEPLIAGGIIEIFQLLPDSAHFVEPLIKTTIKLETVIPQYKSNLLATAPFRGPLAKYLNKYGAALAQFFINEHRLKNPVYSSLLQDIIGRTECEGLRSYLSGSECTNIILNVCFDRPLAIIRSEKAPGFNSSGRTASEVLRMHGINLVDYSIQISSRDPHLRQELEKKQEKVYIAEREEMKVREVMSTIIPGAAEYSEKYAADLRRQHQRALTACEDAKKEVLDIQELLNPNVDKTSFPQGSSPTRSMTTDHLELQLQGFILIGTLMSTDAEYLKTHTDITRAFRWLWRSKGRHLRFLHEDSIPPRYSDESVFLARYLVQYAKINVDDVDVLFDLLRIFLHASTKNFSFVKTFIIDTVSTVLNFDQRNKVMQRFLALLTNADGSEETKLLAIQLIILPMFESWVSRPTCEDGKANVTTDISFLERNMFTMICEQAFTRPKNSRSLGQKLSVELLKLSGLLLDIMPRDFAEHETVVTFAWKYMHLDDIWSKPWALVTLCKYTNAFDTPEDVVLKLYKTLLRASQEEGRSLINSAVNIFMYSLSTRLSELSRTTQLPRITASVICECNTVQQLAHVMNVVLRYEKIFSNHRKIFVPHIISSLNKIALPSTSTLENRTLSIDLVELLLKWGDTSSKSSIKCDIICTSMEDNLDDSESSIMDKGNVDVVTNFIVRFILSISNFEQTDKVTRERASLCFRSLLDRWHFPDIRYIYFDKIISLCANYYDLGFIGSYDSEIQTGKRNADKALSGEDAKSGQTYTNKDIVTEHFLPTKLEQPKALSITLISACLDIFLTMIESSPPHPFLSTYANKVKDFMRPCLSHAFTTGSKEFRTKLKIFLKRLSIVKTFSPSYQPYFDMVQATVDASLASALEWINMVKVTEDKHLDTATSDPIFYFFSSLDYLGDVIPSFPNVYLTSLINISKALLLDHLTVLGLNNRIVSNNSNYPAASRTIAIVEDIIKDNAVGNSSDKISKRNQQAALFDQRTEGSYINRETIVVNCLIRCIKVVGKSNILYRFSELRGQYIHILGKVLDKSDDVKLLVSICYQIASTLCQADQLLTREEKSILLTRIKNLYQKPFSDIKTPLLFQLISSMVMKMHSNPEHAVRLDTVLMGSLLSANFFQRSVVANIILSDMTTNQLEPAELSLSLITNILTKDFEVVGNRFIPSLIVELILVWLQRKKQPIDDYYSETTSVFPSDKTIDIDSDNNIDTVEIVTVNAERLMKSIRIILSSDVQFCQDFFERMTQECWTKAEEEERSAFTEVILALMSRAYHVQFLRRPPLLRIESTFGSRKLYRLNSVWSLSSLLSKLNPPPCINPITLFPIASTYNCSHEIRSILERRMIEYEHIQGDANDKSQVELNCALVRQIYLDLGEKDIWLHLKSTKISSQPSNLAVSLDLYGRVEAALESYNKLVESSQNEMDISKGDECRNRDTDVSLWEDRWIALNRELIQWPLLSEIAENSNLTKLSTECAWKSRDFEKLRLICSSTSGIAALENGEIDQKMSEIFLSFNDGNMKSGDIENVHAQANQLCLYKWQLLPELYASCQAHSHLLHQFHRLIEIRESGQLITDITTHISARTIPESPRVLMNVWRSRLPCEFDSISWWDDVFQWRTHLFNIISNSFSWVEQATLATLHDRPWTAIRQAVLARKHGVKDVALFSLSQLTDMAMDVNDAYAKLREQILTYKNGTEVERTCGLNLINTTNLSYFDATQKSELFRLKAEFLDGLGHRSKATSAYCHSVQICPTSSRSWSSWGDLCWSLYRFVEKQGQETDEAEDEKDTTSHTKQGVQYMAQAMGCYLEAVNCDACEWSRLNLPKCLAMLSKDVTPNGALFQTFEKYGLHLPPWVFLIWIPQILSGLCRMEGRAMKVLLNKILLSYPQAVYFPLRAFYLERRDAERSRNSPEGLQHDSIAHADELMTAFRKAHPALWTSLETILEELILRFRPSHEEELLATMTALLQRAEYQLEHQRRPGESDDGAIRASFKKTLSRISSKFFELPVMDGKSNQKDERLKKITIFIDRYKSSFDADFKDYDTGENFRLQLPDIYNKLQKWKTLLEKQVALTPSSVPLVTISQTLSSYCSSAPDLWPGSCDPISLSSSRNQEELNTDTNIQMSTLLASAKIATNTAMSASRALLAASRLEGGGGLGSAVVEIPGQYAPNSSHDSKPKPELHIKLVRFDGKIQVIFRSGQLARKIGLVGSDGKVYTFLLQFAVPYWTKTDERTAQIHHLFGNLLRRDKNSSRRSLWLKPCPAIPIAQRLRMIYEDHSHVSLEEIYLMDMQRKGLDPTLLHQMFQNEVRMRLESLDPSTDDVTERAVKVEAFQEVCRHVSDNILFDFIHRVLAHDAESLFKFRKVFTNQLAINSLLQYAFDANDRSPSRFMFSVTTGQVLAPDFRFSYNNQGFLDGRGAVPFRLTRNIENLIGPIFLQGVFVPALCSAASAIFSAESRLESVFQLLIRDDIVSWYMSKASQREGTQKPIDELERQLADRVIKNTVLILNRFRECTPRESRSEASKGCRLDDRVRELVNTATSVSSLAEMPLGYQAWL